MLYRSMLDFAKDLANNNGKPRVATRARLTEREVCADDLIDRLIPVFRAVKPMVAFLDTGT